jgi:hypothetical protein
MARTQNQTKQRHLVPFVHLYPHVEKGAERDLRFLSVCLIWGWSDENVGRDGTGPSLFLRVGRSQFSSCLVGVIERCHRACHSASMSLSVSPASALCKHDQPTTSSLSALHTAYLQLAKYWRWWTPHVELGERCSTSGMVQSVWFWVDRFVADSKYSVVGSIHLLSVSKTNTLKTGTDSSRADPQTKHTLASQFSSLFSAAFCGHIIDFMFLGMNCCITAAPRTRGTCALPPADYGWGTRMERKASLVCVMAACCNPLFNPGAHGKQSSLVDMVQSKRRQIGFDPDPS